MKAIINIGEKLGSIDGVICDNAKIRTIINNALKLGLAKKIIDSETTLMYNIA